MVAAVLTGLESHLWADDFEWEGPVNFIDVGTLMHLVTTFLIACPTGRVIYDRPGPQQREVGASRENHHGKGEGLELRFNNGPGLHTNETDMHLMAKLPRVTMMNDYAAAMLRMYNISANEARLRLISRVQCTVAVQGGGSYLGLYMGGKHVILHRKGPEQYGDNYKALTDPARPEASIFVAADEASLVRHARQMVRQELKSSSTGEGKGCACSQL